MLLSVYFNIGVLLRVNDRLFLFIQHFDLGHVEDRCRYTLYRLLLILLVRLKDILVTTMLHHLPLLLLVELGIDLLAGIMSRLQRHLGWTLVNEV